MSISTGIYKVKNHIMQPDKTFKLLSRWTSSETVEYSDGKTAQEKNGYINGITSDVNCEDPTIAASASMVNKVNQNLIPTGGTGEMNLADQVKAIYDTLVTTAPEKAYYWTSSPVNIKDIYPDLYDRLTTGDFLAGSTGATASDNSPACNISGGQVGGNCSVSYNSSTGILSFSGFNNTNYYNEKNYNRIWNAGTLFCMWKGTVNGEKI